MKIMYSFVFLTTLFVIINAQPEEKYVSQYDNVNLDEILQNKRLLKSYIDCGLDKGPCSKEGQLLKELFPDALATECSKCTDKQKEGSKKVFKYLIENEPKLYKELEAKYDPTGKYTQKYKEYAHSQGIKI